MRRLASFPFGAAVGFILALGPSSANAQKIYWTDSGRIMRANLNGSGVEVLIPTPSAINSGIALDLINEKMYWGDKGGQEIQRADLDGSKRELLVTGMYPWSIALDVQAGKMYWTDFFNDKIQRANLDGTTIETLVSSGLASPRGIALDLEAGKMYWADAGTNPPKVQRANFDGSEVEDLLTVTSTGSILSPVSIALDLPSGKMYLGLVDVQWGVDGKIQRANLDGSKIEDIVPPLVLPYTMALDLQARRIYFMGPGIWRANMNGPDIELLTTQAGQPGGIALDLRRNEIPALSEWGLLVMGVVVVLTGCVVLGRRRISTQAARGQAIG